MVTLGPAMHPVDPIVFLGVQSQKMTGSDRGETVNQRTSSASHEAGPLITVDNRGESGSGFNGGKNKGPAFAGPCLVVGSTM